MISDGSMLLKKKVEEFEENVDNYHRFVGLDKEYFNQLADDYSEIYYNSGWEIKQKKFVSHKTTLSARTALFLTLFFFRRYVVGIVQSAMFGCHERTLARIHKRCLKSLVKFFEGKLDWPKSSDYDLITDRRNAETILAGPLLIVDGTVIQIYRSVLKFESGSNDPYFNGHKWKHGVNMLAFVDYTGRIWWNTRVYPGGFTDQKIWNVSQVRNYFTESDVILLGDRGFTFNSKNETEPIHSHVCIWRFKHQFRKKKI